MKITFYFLFAFCFNLVVSCSKPSKNLELALEVAGENRTELEKVLSYYKTNPADSLKYKAAKFLIENMPYHSYKEPDSRFDGVFDSIEKVPDSSETRYRRGVFLKELINISENQTYKTPELVWDIEILNSTFIINNIELAFEAWNRVPKNKRASFDDFCNFILPYRSNDEPIEEGTRLKFYNKYSWVYDRLNEGATLKSIVDSITSEFTYVNTVDLGKYYPLPLSISQIEKSRLGLCDDAVNYFVNLFRSIGIVSAKDYVSHWGNHYSLGHSWLYFQYGDEEYSVPPEGSVDVKAKFRNESMPKANRVSFKHQEIFNYSPLNVDVTRSYVATKNISIENVFNTSTDKPVLCVFDKNKVWEIVTFGVYKKKKNEFTDIGVNVLYMPATITDNGFLPINYPFFVDKNKQIHFFKPNDSIMDSVSLLRKYGLSSPRHKEKVNWIKGLNGGVIQVSNDLNFKKSKTIYKIEKLSSTQRQMIKLNIQDKFKFIRFKSNNKQESYLATLAFYDNEMNKLYEKPFKENVTATNRSGRSRDAAFDHLSLSYSGGKDFILGMEFNKPISVGAIEFQARNDDNHIVEGQDYELFYWNKEWKSLGRQKSKDTVLYYNAPANSLLWLKNLTKGKEEHVFIIDENNKQRWLGFDNVF